jgi:ATP phosphoribosyltransferase
MKQLPGYVKLALPKGKLLPPTASLLDELALGFEDYSDKTRGYRLRSVRFPQLSAKMFQEKDIPIQVAIGNYDLGICGLDWIEELLVRYPANAVVKISNLNYGEGSVYVVVSCRAGISNLYELQDRKDSWRIVSEYPNLAEAFVLDLRLKAFKIFPVWGAAEVYPPEDADLAVLWGGNEGEIAAKGLTCLRKLLPANAFLIANQKSLESKELSQILACFSDVIIASRNNIIARVNQSSEPKLRVGDETIRGMEAAKQSQWEPKEIRLALPDGHQQLPTSQFLKRVGLELHGYSEEMLERRPFTNLDWVSIKVVRPQDMPLQVANGNFDLAITGEDWLLEHLYRFPTSPVAKLLDLNFGEVRIVAAMSRDVPVADVDELRALVQSGELAPLRVASEYVNIADKYLRDNHISRYRLIPTWGATEAFLPEDADLLVDNAQTGRTLAQQNLKIIDTLFQSTACLIGNKDSLASSAKKGKIDFLVQKFQAILP